MTDQLTLAQMRTSPATGLPERTLPICLAQKVVAEVEALSNERVQLRRQVPGLEGDGPRRTAQGAPKRLKEIEARMVELQEEMRRHTGTLRLRGTQSGVWRLWADAHPARHEGRHPDGRPMVHLFDTEVGYGYVNATELMATLGVYAVAFNDKPLEPGEWDFIAENAAPGDLREAAKIVVQMHEAEGWQAPGKSQTPSSTTPDGESVSS